MTDENSYTPAQSTATSNDSDNASLSSADTGNWDTDHDSLNEDDFGGDKLACDSSSQETWEERFKLEGVERFEQAVHKTIKQNVYAVSKVSQRIIPTVIEPAFLAISGFVDKALTRKATTILFRNGWVKPLCATAGIPL